MKPVSHPAPNRGSALITVVFLMGVMALITAGLLVYTRNERRANERNRLVLRARNMSENISAYSAEQLTTKLYRLRSFAPQAYMSGVNQIYLPPVHVLNSAFTSATSGMETRAGLTGSTGMTFIDPATNPNSANAGLQVNTATIPVIAKATASHPSLGSYSAYTEYDLEVDMVPLFQFAVFYNMDMEFAPGADMIIAGPIHTNGNLIARSQSNHANTLQFLDRVSAAGGFFADTGYKGPSYDNTGTIDPGPGGTGPLKLQNPADTVTNIQTNSFWRDHKYGNTTVSPTSLSAFKTFASSSYGVNFRTSVHGVTPLVLPGVSNYSETDNPSTAEDERSNGRQIIQPADPGDSAQLKETKIARRAGLYIITNPDDETRNGILPDGSTVPMRARSYRCWLNTVNGDLSHTLSEVILPGQPSYGPMNAYVNNLPNAYRTNTSVRHNQVLRIPQGGGVDLAGTGYDVGSTAPTMTSFADAYFWDMRRANNNRGGAPFDRATYPYSPRPIAKIDLDMTRFKMMVDRTLSNAATSTIYYPALPSDNGTWGDFIFNPDSTGPSNYGLGLDTNFDQFPGNDQLAVIQRSSTNAYLPASIVLKTWEQMGNGAIQVHAGRYIVSESTDGGATYTDRYTSSGDESSKTYAPSAATGISHIRVRFYKGGAAPSASRLCDEEVIPIIDSNGSGTVSLALTNDYHMVPTSNSGNSANWAIGNSNTEARVYVGGVDDTANWTFAVASTTGGAGGTWGSGLNANRFTLNAITSDTGTITFRATKGGTSVTKTMTLVKQYSLSGVNNPANKAFWIIAQADTAGDPFRMYFAPADPNDTRIQTDPSTFAVNSSNLINTLAPCPWFDGITVYVHSVDAEVRAQTAGVPNRIDSGVRLWNGRGSVVSLSRFTYPGRTGFLLATNDAAYIVGHFNADGSTNSNASSTSNPGGYSARYPESASEMLTSVMADAVTILSQPVFTQQGSGTPYTYRQTDGWSDSMSAHRRGGGNYSSSWQTTNPSSGNTRDGTNDAFWPAAMPNLGNLVAGPAAPSGSAPTEKLDPSETEISTALLVGIVPTNHNPSGLTDGAPSPSANNQTSGGVHNFPRLLEQWSANNGTRLYIRGSMVAMFESRVAMEPWSLRVYDAPIRLWGLHESLRNVNHDIPLEPVMLNARRVRFRELTAADYAAQKTTIEALPH